VLQAVPAAIVVLDGQDRVQLWSAAAERLFGWSATEVAARPLGLVLGSEAAGLVSGARASDRATVASLAVAPRQGPALRLTMSCVATRGPQGTRAGVVAVFQETAAGVRDVDQRFVDQRFAEAQRLEVVDRIAGAIAHDLKNVFSAIKGFAIVASEGLAADHHARGDAEQILKAVERGAALTHKLLAFSRNPVLEPSLLDLNQILRGLDKTIRRLLAPGRELVVREVRGLGLVRADAAQVEQVIVNLMLNARDATAPGSRLVVETASVELDGPSAEAAGLPAGRYARVVVFAEADERALARGLPATFHIVRQMGGQVAVRREPGRGTAFVFDLPVTDERPADPAAARAAEDAEATILIVEDDELVRTLTMKLLRRRGYRVLEARGPVEAAARATEERGPIDLLLSDVGLPQASGPELARKLAADRPGMKVLFMSGYGRAALIERGLLPGPGVLEKPFSPEALLDRIRAVLGDRSNQSS